MLATMYAAPGIGLAAIQVGEPVRIIVMDLAREGEPPAPRYFVNPEILWASEETQPYEEGVFRCRRFSTKSNAQRA